MRIFWTFDQFAFRIIIIILTTIHSQSPPPAPPPDMFEALGSILESQRFYFSGEEKNVD